MGAKVPQSDVKFNICLEDNSFKLEINDPNEILDSAALLDKLRRNDFWFAIYANCPCNNSVNSLDVTANHVTGKFENIGIEQEAVWLKNTDYKLHVSMHPLQKIMRVTKLIEDVDGSLLDNSDEIKLPLVTIDWSDEKQAVDKIRTMMVFS